MHKYGTAIDGRAECFNAVSAQENHTKKNENLGSPLKDFCW